MKLLRLVLMLAAGSGWSASPGGPSADRLIVAFRPGISDEAKARALEAHGLAVLDRIPRIDVVLVHAGDGRGPSVQAELKSAPEVDMVAEDLWRNWIEEEPASFQARPLPNLDSVLEGVGLRKDGPPRGRAGGPESEAQWGVKRVNAPAVWATNQGAGVKVAVIDTGIDPGQPELGGNVAGGVNMVESGAPWADDHFHGTHVAGIIAAALDGRGVAGVAPKAALYAVKVLAKDGSGNLFSIMQGVMWCAENGMQVANMSLGAPQQIPMLDRAIAYAVGAGVTVVAAAGNDSGAVNCPACYEDTIAVSALDEKDGIAPFSSRGPEVDFIAPGVKIPSTVPLVHDPSGVKAYSGTSMAAPHVSGLAALAVAGGAAGPARVRAALAGAASRLGGLRPSDQGDGLVDAARLAR